jgi:multisubunit Na+/H+ antiporter MnhG subunit
VLPSFCATIDECAGYFGVFRIPDLYNKINLLVGTVSA